MPRREWLNMAWMNVVIFLYSTGVRVLVVVSSKGDHLLDHLPCARA